MGNNELFELSAEYNDYDEYEDIYDDNEEVKPESIVYVPYIPEYNIQDIGLGMEIPVSNPDFIYLDKPTVRISDNKPVNIQRPNIRPKQTLQKPPQQRIDYINKKRTDINHSNNISQPKEEIVMKPKKKETKEIDYQKVADILYPTMRERSQIKSTERYKLLDNTPKQNTKVFYNYEPMTLLGDSNYKAVNLYEKEKLQKENEILKKALEYEIKMKNRADILYPTMQEKKEVLTGGAASIVTNEIVGVKKGEPKTLEEAIYGVNPNYSLLGNITYKTNCQADVVVADARVRGFDIEVSIDYENEIKDKLSQRPNIAYIDPKTGRIPEFIKMNVNNEFECERGLDNIVKQGERYIFAFQWKQKTQNGHNISHIVILTKEKDNKLKIYDPQNRAKYENVKSILNKIQYQFSLFEEKNPPKILRVDDKEINSKIINQISKPARKK